MANETMLSLSLTVPESIRPYKNDRILDFYEDLVADWTEKQINILEVGVLRGGMILTLLRRLPKARVLGIDIAQPPQAFWDDVDAIGARDRVAINLGSQADRSFVRHTVEQFLNGDKLDMVTDDALHTYKGARPTFEELFLPHLREGGFYAIEDWGAGYFVQSTDGHPDGRHGLARLVKQLIDEVALPDRTALWKGQRSLSVDQEYEPAISKALVTNGLAVFFRGPGNWLAPLDEPARLDLRVVRRNCVRSSKRVAKRMLRRPKQ